MNRVDPMTETRPRDGEAPDAGHPGDPTARAGSPLADGAQVAAREAVVEALRTVFDPEIPVNIYELGLIYDLAIAPTGDVKVTMSLTSPSCPVAGQLPQQVADAVATVAGTGEVDVALVWDPPWGPERMSEDAKLALGMD